MEFWSASGSIALTLRGEAVRPFSAKASSIKVGCIENAFLGNVTAKPLSTAKGMLPKVVCAIMSMHLLPMSAFQQT